MTPTLWNISINFYEFIFFFTQQNPRFTLMLFYFFRFVSLAIFASLNTAPNTKDTEIEMNERNGPHQKSFDTQSMSHSTIMIERTRATDSQSLQCGVARVQSHRDFCFFFLFCSVIVVRIKESISTFAFRFCAPQASISIPSHFSALKHSQSHSFIFATSCSSDASSRILCLMVLILVFFCWIIFASLHRFLLVLPSFAGFRFVFTSKWLRLFFLLLVRWNNFVVYSCCFFFLHTLQKLLPSVVRTRQQPNI